MDTVFEICALKGEPNLMFYLVSQWFITRTVYE